jgi:hypothetical protein
MRALLLALYAASALAAGEQATKDKPPAKKSEKAAAEKANGEKPKRRLSIGIKKDGAVGDDAAGGGQRSGASSMGGTPGTPSGSFTR